MGLLQSIDNTKLNFVHSLANYAWDYCGFRLFPEKQNLFCCVCLFFTLSESLAGSCFLLVSAVDVGNTSISHFLTFNSDQTWYK